MEPRALLTAAAYKASASAKVFANLVLPSWGLANGGRRRSKDSERWTGSRRLARGAGYALVVLAILGFRGSAAAAAADLTCFGVPATIVGTERNNTLVGTAGDDVIVGLGGNDSIDGRGGNDLICGGPGNDNIRGGDGNDRIDGGDGKDIIKGQKGDDQIFGGPGADTLEGWEGRDRLDGGEGNDAIKGQQGDDSLDGGPGIDTLDGGPGSDTCVRGEGNVGCEGGCVPAPEICNGVDDDCDGAPDNGFDVSAPCTAGVGACARQGSRVCSADGAMTVCNAVEGQPQPEVCGNGVDEDCDGLDLTCGGTIGATIVNPDSASAGVPLAVLVTSSITDTSVIPGSVSLERINASGGVLATIGTLHDDGLSGDVSTGDGIFSISTTVYENTPGTVTFRVSALFQGSNQLVYSAPVTVSISGVATSITILTPSSGAYLNLSPVTVTGTVGDPAALVNINGVSAPVSGTGFVATVPLNEGPNTLTAVATNSNGTTNTSSVLVTLDTTPPHVAIYSPAGNTVTTDAAITVTGLVNDIVVGTVNPEQATVSVNGVSAQVINRTFSAASIPLALGPNTIQATGVDRAGNGVTASIMVTRQAPTQTALRLFTGNGQAGPIRSLLPEPLVAQLLNGAAQPIPNTPVVFRVINQDGTVNMIGSQGAGLSSVAVNTDVQGLALVNFTLGSHAGAGNNIVEASTTGVTNTAVFTASATPTTAALIIVDTGNNQSGVIGQPLPLPFVAVVTDAGYNRLGGVPVTFTMRSGAGDFSGASTFQATSDSDGRVLANLTLGPDQGVSNNLVEASFEGNAGAPVAFTASGLAPGPADATRISGVVLDNSNAPIPGVTMHLFQINQGNRGNVPQEVATAVQTDAQGQFVVQPAPVGVFKLMADGGTAQRPGAWPTIEYDVVTVSGQNNTLGVPVYLPELLPGNRLCVSETTGGTLTIPQAPGFSLTIAAGSATFPGGSRSGCVSVTPVNMDKVPMAPGFGQQPRFVLTIQPVGTTFNPPAAIAIPNVDGLAPRAVTEMYSYDHDLASFVSIGAGTVSEDGSVIRSDPGVGVLKAGWHCGGNPNPTGSAGTCPTCKKCNGATCINDDGAGCNDNDACTSASGTSQGPDRCQGGSCKGTRIDFSEHDTTFTEDASVPPDLVSTVDNVLHRIPGLDAIHLREIKFAIEGKVRDCCENSRGVVTNGIKEVRVQASLKAEVKDLTLYGPPTISRPFDLGFGIVDLDFNVGAKITADFSFSGSGGTRQDLCRDTNCFFGEIMGGTTVTAKATAMAIVCVETYWTSRTCGSIEVTPVSFSAPISVSGTINKPDCGTTLRGTFNFGKLKFKMAFGFGITDPPMPTSGSVEHEGFKITYPPLEISYEKTVLEGFTVNFP